MGWSTLAEGTCRDVVGLTSSQVLLLVGICWVPVVLLGIFGFAAVLRRERKPSAASQASAGAVRLGTIETDRDGAGAIVSLEWRDGGFFSGDGQPLLPAAIAELDGRSKVQWATAEQASWFRGRFVEERPGPEQGS
jgi:hypothetical protein